MITRNIQQAGAGLHSLAESVLDTTGDFVEQVLTTLCVAARLKRRSILERTGRGRADAKAAGVKFGRKPTLAPHQQREACRRIEEGKTQKASPAASTSHRRLSQG